MHYVLFWLKEPDNQEIRNRFTKSLSNFVDNCEYVRDVHIGTPADTNRPVVDNSYTFSLVVNIDSKEAHHLYQEHPLHKRFIEESSELWEKVQVYDSIAVS